MVTHHRIMVLYMFYLSLVIRHTWTQKWGTPKLVYEWATLEFDWPSGELEEEAKDLDTYIPERNLVAGIKVYKNDVYLTVPRWFWEKGHPATLVKVVSVDGRSKLKPYPNWAAQELSNCTALQYVQGMEIDPNTGLMYVIDTGRVGGTKNLCPAKIVVYDLNSSTEVAQYELPEDVASPTGNFLNDIVLDYVGGRVRYAYITDAGDARIVVFDFQAQRAFTVRDETMLIESKEAVLLTIGGKTYNFSVPLDGIAMSKDFKYVYYCSLAGFNLYQIPTSSLRVGKADGVRLVGRKLSQSGGIAYGTLHLYYGALDRNAVYFWDVDEDMLQQKKTAATVTLQTQVLVIQDNETMQWPDTFAFDDQGWIWFVSNRLHEFRDAKGIPTNGTKTMRVWKVYVGEQGYLSNASSRLDVQGSSTNGVSRLKCAVGAGLILPLITFSFAR